MLQFLTITFMAITCQAQIWPPAVDRDYLAQIQIPAPSAAKALPRDGVNYSAAEEVLIKEFFLPGLNLEITEAEVSMQMKAFNNSLSPEQALRIAITKAIADYSEPSGPLAHILNSMGVGNTPNKTQLTQAKEKLLKLMNMPGSEIKILSIGKTAPHGEAVADNWIFSLKLNYQQTVYWLIVHRIKSYAYVYGVLNR